MTEDTEFDFLGEDGHTYEFYKEMRNLVTKKKHDPHVYPWFFNYAMDHRDRLKQIADTKGSFIATYAKETLDALPSEPTLGQRIKFRLRRMFNMVYDRIPQRIGPFRFP